MRIGACLILLLSLASPALAADTLTLSQAWDIALKNHPQLRAAEFGTQAAAEGVDIARAGYLPQVTGNAVGAFNDAGTRIAATDSLNDPTVIERGSAGIGMSQLITDFGKTHYLVASSKMELEAEKQRANLTRDQVILAVTRSYYNVLRAQSLLTVAQATLKARQTLLDQINSLRNAKMKSDLDLSMAKQSVGEANLLMLQAGAGVSDAQASLAEALGYGEPKPFVLTEPVKAPPPPPALDPLIEQALAGNPQLASLKAQASAAEKEAQAESRDGYPTVSALGFAGGTPWRQDSQHIEPEYATAGINVSIPFYTGGRITAQEKQSQYRAQSLAQDATDMENKLRRDVRLAFDSVQTSYQNIGVTAELLKNASQALDLTQARYQLGKNSIVDLTETQLAKTRAEIANANATYDYLIQLAMLAYETGQSRTAQENP